MMNQLAPEALKWNSRFLLLSCRINSDTFLAIHGHQSAKACSEVLELLLFQNPLTHKIMGKIKNHQVAIVGIWLRPLGNAAYM